MDSRSTKHFSVSILGFANKRDKNPRWSGPLSADPFSRPVQKLGFWSEEMVRYPFNLIYFLIFINPNFICFPRNYDVFGISYLHVWKFCKSRVSFMRKPLKIRYLFRFNPNSAVLFFLGCGKTKYFWNILVWDFLGVFDLISFYVFRDLILIDDWWIEMILEWLSVHF